MSKKGVAKYDRKFFVNLYEPVEVVKSFVLFALT